ncbi:MAG TPA: LuxR C-terminal-related transcriptional regulator [Burkholderiaceae bacterium]|nr:LuxR C-terminal-related transcriptional regulator [Burkholderiaceae bacterium]
MSTPAYAPLRKTKLNIPPPRPHLVQREQLLERLEQEASRPLTLISAPAGFGKTTLLTSWLRAGGSRPRAAWLSLDDEDNDPVRFFYYIVAALQTVEAGIGRAPISLFGYLQVPAARDLMTLLLNELGETAERLVLVLDDYHVVKNPEIDTALAFLVDHAPDSLRLLVATREEPRLPLARWRALQRISEIDLETLRFTPDEAALFLKQTMGLRLDAETVRLLEARTDGWIAGLQMAALSLQHHAQADRAVDAAQVASAFGGGHRYVIDYLASEVLRQQPDEIRSFLQRTAILERLSAPLCDAVTGRTDSKLVLARLEQANMFLLRLDDHRQWYRYHQLFADFLRTGLDPAETCALHLKASAWHEAQGLIEEAFRHALAAPDAPLAVRLFRVAVESLLRRGEFPTALAWLQALPDGTVRSHGDLAGYMAWLLYLGGRLEKAEAYSALAYSVQDDSVPVTHRATMLTFQAFLAINRGDPKRALPLAEEALQQLGDSQTFFRACALSLLGHAQRFCGEPQKAVRTLQQAVDLGRSFGNDLITLDALGTLAPLMLAQGQLREAMALCRRAAEQYADARGKPLPVAGLVYIPLGVLYYEINDLQSALHYLKAGVDLCQQLGMVYYALAAQRALARVQHAAGDREAAWNTLAAASELARHSENPQRRRSLAALSAELHLREGNLDAAARTLDEVTKAPGSATGRESLVRAQLALARGDPQAACQVLDRAEEVARKNALLGNLIAIHVLRALCKRALGNRSAAARECESAVSLAASGGFRRVFFDAGRGVAALLDRARDVAPAFVADLLEELAPADEAQPESPSLIEPLSGTQIQILNQLDRGLTNQEIAEKLEITVGTTKWHLNQIFGKLQVRNRVEAIAKARELKLI